MRTFLHMPRALRLSLVLIAVFTLSAFGSARQNPVDENKCGTTQTTIAAGPAVAAKLDTVLNHPDDYFGKTVTVEGEMHRTFSDQVFSIEDDDFLRDDDLLIITTSSKSEVVVPVKDSIEEGKDVRVTGVIQPFNRTEMECKYGPLQIESRASHYKEGSPVMIIERSKLATLDSSEREKPSPAREVEPIPAPVAGELETKSPEETELPRTGSELPLIFFSGVLSILAASGIRLLRRQ
jgi:hypothetical protein